MDYKDWLCDNRYVDENGVMLSDAEHYQIYLFGAGDDDIEDYVWEEEHPGWEVQNEFECPPRPVFCPPDPEGKRRERINNYLARPLKRVERAF